MTAQHTPVPAAGPWEVMPWSDGFVWPLPEPENKPHAVIWTAHESYESIAWVIPSPHAEADARLIAAAPEMLEALRTIQDLVSDEDKPSMTRLDAAHDIALAAIDKAEGRQP